MNRLVIIGNGFDMAHSSCLCRMYRSFWRSAAQLRDSPENSVRAACAKSGMKREMGHQMARHILHTVVSAEIDT